MRVASCKGTEPPRRGWPVRRQWNVRCRNFNRHNRRSASWREELALGEGIVGASFARQDQRCKDRGNSLDSLQMCMRSVLQEMVASSTVQPNMVDEARRQMEQLFMSLTALSQQSQAANTSFKTLCTACLTMRQSSADSCFWREVPIDIGLDGYEHQSLA